MIKFGDHFGLFVATMRKFFFSVIGSKKVLTYGDIKIALTCLSLKDFGHLAIPEKVTANIVLDICIYIKPSFSFAPPPLYI